MMSRRLRVGVIFGGRSVEHEVSLVSARAVIANLSPERFEIVPVGITKEGRWVTAADPQVLLQGGPGAGGLTERSLSGLAGTRSAAVTGDSGDHGLLTMGTSSKGSTQLGKRPLDVVFPLVHGPLGEDGTLQGLLEMAGIPYVGAGVAASAIGMDKALMKEVFRARGLPVTRHEVLLRARIRRDVAGAAREALAALRLPLFVKPANGGSSVGVSKVKRAEDLAAALSRASAYDRKVIVEEGVDAREVECAVLGNDAPETSVVGEIVPSHEFYDYEAKYIDDRSELIVPADLTPAQTAEVKRLATEAFLALDAAGMARVDFFVRRSDGAVILNEVNTIPGFTPISMYPRLWAASGVAFPQLVERLIALALERHRDREESTRSLGSEGGGAGA
jgi:D-alanine-D-alanine ligase